MSEKYRARTEPYGSGSAPVTSVRLRPSTLEGFQQIRDSFRARFPMEKFPTLSACLDRALEKYLAEVGESPLALRREVAEFQAKYLKAEPGA